MITSEKPSLSANRRNTVRFTLAERERRRQAQHVLDDPNATPQQKTIARQNIEDIFKSAQGRLDERKAKKAIGPPPDRASFDNFEDYVVAEELYHRELDKIAAAKILSDPSASFPQRERARRRLEAMPHVLPGGRLLQNRVVAPVRRYKREPGEKERAAYFLDELQKEAANA